MGVKTTPLVLGSSLYPAAFTAGLHSNYDAVPSAAAYGVLYLTNAGGGTSTLGGLLPGNDGDLLLLVIQDAASPFAIAQEDGTSLPPWRFNFALSFPFGRGGVLLRYDGALRRWTRLWSATA
jgi:hypothetical protein